jgi:hypothetical protein
VLSDPDLEGNPLDFLKQTEAFWKVRDGAKRAGQNRAGQNRDGVHAARAQQAASKQTHHTKASASSVPAVVVDCKGWPGQSRAQCQQMWLFPP